MCNNLINALAQANHDLLQWYHEDDVVGHSQDNQHDHREELLHGHNLPTLCT